MSKLDELILKLCPNGVEYKELQEVLKIKNGKDYKGFLDGDIPVYGSGGIMTYIDHYAYDKPSVLIPRKGSIDKLYYVDYPFWNVDTIFYTEIDEKQVMPRYVYHCLAREHLENLNTAGGVPSLTQKVLNKVKIPVPPMEVQREIVHILDEFTKLSAELSAKLSAELQARKKQYEYYRNQLLSFGDTIEKKPLSEIADTFRGEYITKKDSVAGEIPVILGGQEPAYYINKSNHEGEIVVVARSGASAGFVSYWNEPIYVTDGFGFEAKKGVTTPRYLYYSLKRHEKELNGMKRGAGVPHVSGEMLAKIEIPVPPVDVQERLVSVLDNFETICHDLSIGLPAEIEARQKQYEYYRDKLLNFKEKEASS